MTRIKPIKMKTLAQFLITFFLPLFFVACTVDDSEEENEIINANSNNNTTNYTVSYKNQMLSGKIDGKSWTALGGRVSSSSTHYFHIADTLSADTCTNFLNQESRVIFSHDNPNNTIVQLGEHPLVLDWSNTSNNKTITLVRYKNGTPHNTIVDKGAYEILSVDTIKNIINGRMDAFYDDDNFVNGNFELKYCR